MKVGAEYRDKNNFEQTSKQSITALPFSLNSQLLPGTDTQYQWGGFQSFRISPAADQAFYDLQSGIPLTAKPDTGSYQSTEDIGAAYLMGGLTAGKLKIVAGARVEDTHFWIQGVQEDITTSVFSQVDYTKDYTNVLPDIVLTYTLDPKTILRASWTYSIARPDYADTVPGRTVDDINHLVTQGNPEIDALLGRQIGMLRLSTIFPRWGQCPQPSFTRTSATSRTRPRRGSTRPPGICSIPIKRRPQHLRWRARLEGAL